MPHERRRHVRKRVDLAATLVTQEDDERFEAHVADLSVGGAFLEMAESFPFGTLVVLEIAMPQGVISLPGTIRWAKPDGCGVQFGNLGVKQTYAITEHLAGLEPAPDSRRV